MSIWALLAEGQSPRLYRCGQLIYLQGTAPTFFYYLLQGTVRSFISSADGEERVLTVHRSGALMGEASFFDQCPRVSSAMAVEDSYVISVDRQRLDLIFHQHPELAFPMLQHLAGTVRMLSGHLDSISLTAQQRIARYLLSQDADQNGVIHCTHEEIGQSVGVSRITVSRVLGALSKGMHIETGYGAIRIADAEFLKQLL